MSDSDDEYGPPLPPGFQQKPEPSSGGEKSYIGPTIPSHLTGRASAGGTVPGSGSGARDCSSDSGNSSDSDGGIGPALPPGFKQHKRDKESETSASVTGISGGQKIIGPCLPPHLQAAGGGQASSESDSENDKNTSYPMLPEDDVIGPMPCRAGDDGQMSVAAELEQRARKMKDKLLGKDTEEAAPSRETWMTELPPEIGTNFGLSNRTFRKKAAPTGDRSGWTDTPSDKEKKDREGQKRKAGKEVYVPTETERKMTEDIEKYNKHHRSESLLEMHEKERKKKQKKDDTPQERRPFDRDLDLQVNKLDEAQRRAIIKKSRDLGTRFKSGGMGTSFL